jgi:hypothetical protein
VSASLFAAPAWAQQGLLARTYVAVLGGYTAGADLRVTLKRDALALPNTNIKIVVRKMSDGSLTTTQTMNVGTKSRAFSLPSGFACVQRKNNVLVPAPQADTNVNGVQIGGYINRKYHYEIAVYDADVQAGNPAVAASPARVVGAGITGTHGAGLRAFNPGTKDWGNIDYVPIGMPPPPEYNPAEGLACRPGPEPWPEPEPTGIQLF